MSEKRYLTPPQLAERLGGNVRPKTLGVWRSKGTGPIYEKIGGRIRYEIADVEAWERNQRFVSTSQRA